MNPLLFLVKKFAAKIIAVDDTVVPLQQLQVLQDILKAQKFELRGKDAKKLLLYLKRKHLVNSITVVKRNSNLVFSSEGNGEREAEKATNLFQFVNSSLSNPSAIAVKCNKEWSTLFSTNGLLFVIRSNNSLSTIELRAVAKDVEEALGKQL